MLLVSEISHAAPVTSDVTPEPEGVPTTQRMY